MKTLSPGIDFEVRKETLGNKPKTGQKVSVHYMVSLSYDFLEEGPWIDSSYDREQEYEFVVGSGEVIQGLDIAIQNMNLLELHWLKIAPELAFGSRGVQGRVPPNSELFVGIYLMSIQ